MEFRLWAIFSNFGQNMKGQKITAAAEISANQKIFFLLDQIQSTFSISEFFFHVYFCVKFNGSCLSPFRSNFFTFL